MNIYYSLGNGIFCLLLALQAALAQSAQTDSSDVGNAAAYATQIYMHQTNSQLHLYNGAEYITGTEGYVKGHPYFVSDLAENGTVTYDHITYPDVPLLYDISKDEVVVEHMGNGQKIKLHNQKIQNFTLAGHTFVRVQTDSLSNSPIRTGLYDRLYTGTVNLYARRIKIAQQATRGVNKEYLLKNSYFIEKDHNFYSVKKKSSILKVFKDQKKSLLSYLKENHIKFQQDPEYAMIKLAEQYSHLVNHL